MSAQIQGILRYPGANNLKVAGAGFGTDTNVITLIDKQQTRHLEQMSKEAAAMEILTVLRDMMK